jgi:hypothetical protein
MKSIYRNTYPLQGFCVGCVQILDGLIKVASLGFVGAMMATDVLVWFTRRRIKKSRQHQRKR